jgi:hypothetical protein
VLLLVAAVIVVWAADIAARETSARQSRVSMRGLL